MEFLLVLFSIISGILAAMGLGGGTIFIPLLTVFLKYEQVIAQGLNLVGFWFVAPIALFFHLKNKYVDFKKALFVLIFALPFSSLGAFIAHRVDNEVLKKIFGLFLIIISFTEFYDLFGQKRSNSSRQS